LRRGKWQQKFACHSDTKKTTRGAAKKVRENAEKVEKVGEKFSQLFFCFNVIVDSAFL